WFRRHLRWLRMQHRVTEPVGEVAAAVARIGWRRLRLAAGITGRALDADVEVIVVTVHRPDLPQPAAVVAGIAAERLLDRGIDEDALDLRILRGGLDHFRVAFGPNPRID